MTEEEKKTIIREKHPGRVAQGHKLERKEEILRKKEQSTEQSVVQSTEQSSVQSNGAYVYGIRTLVVLAISVCVFLTYPKNKKLVNEKQDQTPKRRCML